MCPPFWDNASCIPAAAAGHLATLPCMTSYEGQTFSPLCKYFCVIYDYLLLYPNIKWKKRKSNAIEYCEFHRMQSQSNKQVDKSVQFEYDDLATYKSFTTKFCIFACLEIFVCFMLHTAAASPLLCCRQTKSL